MFQFELKHGILYFFGTPESLVVIDLTGFRYQLRFIGKLSRNEIRIDGNTMASYAGTRLQDMNPRVLVGQFNQFPNIDAGLVANERQFVGESDLYVTGGVLGQFAHLRRFSICLVQGSFDEPAVKPDRFLCRLRVDPTDDTIVMDQFINDISR